MTAGDFPLQEAPDRIFDPELWSKLKAEYAAVQKNSGFPYSDSGALEALRPDPGILEYTRNEAAKRGDQFAVNGQRVAVLRKQLLDQFMDKLKSGLLPVPKTPS